MEEDLLDTHTHNSRIVAPLMHGKMALCWIADGFSNLRSVRSITKKKRPLLHLPVGIYTSQKLFFQVHMVKLFHHLVPVGLYSKATHRGKNDAL